MLGGGSTAGAGAGSLGSAETRILSAKAQSRADDDIQSFADLCCPVPWTSQNAGLVTGPNAGELCCDPHRRWQLISSSTSRHVDTNSNCDELFANRKKGTWRADGSDGVHLLFTRGWRLLLPRQGPAQTLRLPIRRTRLQITHQQQRPPRQPRFLRRCADRRYRGRRFHCEE